MKLECFTSINNAQIAIPSERITGFIKTNNDWGNTFISTGADTPEGGENGWHVIEEFETVKAILQSC